MLPQIYRLTYQEFIRNTNYRTTYHSAGFDITIKPSLKSGVRILIIVSKSLDKRSTLRNQTKRIIQESLRNHLKNFHQNFDLMIKSRKILKKEERAQTEKELLILLGKAGVI